MLLKNLRMVMNEADEVATSTTPTEDTPATPIVKQKKPTRQDDIEKASVDGLANEETKYASMIRQYLPNVLKAASFTTGTIKQTKGMITIPNTTEDIKPIVEQSIIAALGTENFKKITHSIIFTSTNSLIITITLKDSTAPKV